MSSFPREYQLSAPRDHGLQKRFENGVVSRCYNGEQILVILLPDLVQFVSNLVKKLNLVYLGDSPFAVGSRAFGRDDGPVVYEEGGIGLQMC